MSECTIMVNGEVYEKKQKMSGNIYIVRTYSAGVFMGEIKHREGKEVEMTNARRLWKWAGAASLSQLAMEGTKDPENCKFPCPVKRVVLLEAIEILECSAKAVSSINEVEIWEM